MGGEFIDRQAGNFLTEGRKFLDKSEIFKFSRKAVLPIATSNYMPSACSVMNRATAVLSTPSNDSHYSLQTIWPQLSIYSR